MFGTNVKKIICECLYTQTTRGVQAQTVIGRYEVFSDVMAPNKT